MSDKNRNHGSLQTETGVRSDRNTHSGNASGKKLKDARIKQDRERLKNEASETAVVLLSVIKIIILTAQHYLIINPLCSDTSRSVKSADNFLIDKHAADKIRFLEKSQYLSSKIAKFTMAIGRLFFFLSGPIIIYNIFWREQIDAELFYFFISAGYLSGINLSKELAKYRNYHRTIHTLEYQQGLLAAAIGDYARIELECPSLDLAFFKIIFKNKIRSNSPYFEDVTDKKLARIFLDCCAIYSVDVVSRSDFVVTTLLRSKIDQDTIEKIKTLFLASIERQKKLRILVSQINKLIAQLDIPRENVLLRPNFDKENLRFLVAKLQLPLLSRKLIDDLSTIFSALTINVKKRVNSHFITLTGFTPAYPNHFRQFSTQLSRQSAQAINPQPLQQIDSSNSPLRASSDESIHQEDNPNSEVFFPKQNYSVVLVSDFKNIKLKNSIQIIAVKIKGETITARWLENRQTVVRNITLTPDQLANLKKLEINGQLPQPIVPVLDITLVNKIISLCGLDSSKIPARHIFWENRTISYHSDADNNTVYPFRHGKVEDTQSLKKTKRFARNNLSPDGIPEEIYKALQKEVEYPHLLTLDKGGTGWRRWVSYKQDQHGCWFKTAAKIKLQGPHGKGNIRGYADKKKAETGEVLWSLKAIKYTH